MDGGGVREVAPAGGGGHLVEAEPQPAGGVSDQAARCQLELGQRPARAVAQQVEQLRLGEAGPRRGQRAEDGADEARPVELVVALVAVEHDLDERRQVGRREQRCRAAAAA